MACAKPSDCAPCSKCPDSPAPVMPRCDILLNDGVYANATVVVENGCIIEVLQGIPLLYQPDNNCAGAGGGSRCAAYAAVRGACAAMGAARSGRIRRAAPDERASGSARRGRIGRAGRSARLGGG